MGFIECKENEHESVWDLEKKAKADKNPEMYRQCNKCYRLYYRWTRRQYNIEKKMGDDITHCKKCNGSSLVWTKIVNARRKHEESLHKDIRD